MDVQILGDCCLEEKKKKSKIAPSLRDRPKRVLFVLRVYQLPFFFTKIFHQGAVFQGWLLRCCGDMLPVRRRRFHLCSSQDRESLQRQRERRWEEGAGSGNRNAHEALTVSGKWVSVVAPASSRCQGCEIPNYGCKFCTTASCLITPDRSFRSPFLHCCNFCLFWFNLFCFIYLWAVSAHFPPFINILSA